MIEEFNSEGWRDFAKRYQDTYGWFTKENGQKLLVQVGAVDDKTLSFFDKDGMAYHARSNTGNTFTFIPVIKGSYQYNDSVVVVTRVPATQWKRGICQANTYIYDLATLRSITVGFSTLAALFAPKDNSVLLQWCNTRKGNICLDGVFSIVNNYVYVYSTVVGVYVPEENSVMLRNLIFKQELKDTFTNLQLDILVVDK